jgi:hypothetical protein
MNLLKNVKIANAPARAMLDRFLKDPFSEEAQKAFVLSMHGNGLAEDAHREFRERGRGMMVGPFIHDDFAGFQYAVRDEIEKQAPDPDVRRKALEFVDKYDPATQWIIMLVDTKGGFLTLTRCARERPGPKARSHAAP